MHLNPASPPCGEDENISRRTLPGPFILQSPLTCHEGVGEGRVVRGWCTPTLAAVSAKGRYARGGCIKMCSMPGLLYLRALEKPQSSKREEEEEKKNKQQQQQQKGQRAEPWGRGKGWKEEPGGLEGEVGEGWQSHLEGPSAVSARGQSHQTGLPRFQSLLTFVNHQPVSLHRRALPAVTPSTQTGWQQLLRLKEGLWISQH